MKNWIITAIVIATIAHVEQSYAGSYQGKVKNVFAYNERIFVDVYQGGYDNSNTCTENTGGMKFWIDPTTDYGKALLAIALSAKMSDKLVWAAGSGSCINGPGGKAEELKGIDLKG